jgi:hypothetical protein
MEQAILKALEGLLLPPLRQLVVEYYQLSPKRKEELSQLLSKSSTEINTILNKKQTRHEVECFLTEWILPYSTNEILPDAEFEEIGCDCTVIAAIIDLGCGMNSRSATATALRSCSPFIIQHIGLNGISLQEALLLLFTPDNEPVNFIGTFNDFDWHCGKHGHKGPTRCSKCIRPLFWYLCKLYQAFDGPRWRIVFERLVEYGFIDLASEWVNRNHDIARVQFTTFNIWFPLVAVCKPEITQFAKLCQSLK